MTKLLWHSVAPWCPTGYGTQTALFTPKIAALDDVDLAISSGFGLEGGPINWNGIHVYPGEDWNRTALQWAVHHGAGEPCTVITLMDVWPLDRELYKAIDQQGRLACWVPVDHMPAPTAVVQFLQDSGAVPIAMSRFGEAQLRDSGLDPLYVPHGVDTNVYQYAANREQLRELLKVPKDAFVVGMVANNQGYNPPRKAFPQAIQAFSAFRQDHPDALLYFHTEMRQLLNFDEDSFVVGMVANNQGQSPGRKAFSEAFLAFSMFREKHPDAVLYLHAEMSGFRNGLNLWRLAQRFDIPDEALRVTDQVMLEHLVPPGVLAGLYNSFDVLLNPSYGEGFGIPIVEAQACGTPVIVTDHTAMPELCGAGWKVGGSLWDHTMMDSFWMQPSVDEIVAALERAYESRGDEKLRVQAREFAVQYDADHVLETYWKPALEKIQKPREVQPLRPNRKMRRAAAKAGV